MQRTIMSTIALIALGVGSLAYATETIDWNTIDTGGGASSGGDLTLEGTIAQPDTEAMTGGTFELTGGYWAVTTGASQACPGDTDGSGTVDVLDLLAVILDWDTDGSGNNGDVDGSGNVDVTDLVTVILAWGAC